MPIRALVVDDQLLFAELLAQQLTSMDDIEVVGVARTAERAIEIAAAERPDVVLLDYRLPDRNGIDAISDITSASPDARIIMLTAIQDDAIFLAAIQRGCTGFISKHESVDVVEAAVRAAGRGSPWIDPDLLIRAVTLDADPTHEALPSLTPREHEVLDLAAAGLTNPEIARELHLSVKTVGNHLQRILAKLGVRSKLEAVTTAAQRGLVRLD